ncbi:hypothetical protein ACTCUF_04085 [Lactococcus lactis]|uniref:hypothetical protein n=1 Tax=Lactococcus lactis TaxID=1358 RepID=UPI001455F44B|nr:hypothetical protein [Lactococcus lactis]MCT0439568.1 hypothetical protein [Lactococcus lactis subsp. lactis]NLS46165.1 hypothetical protein [Lactococcus lactis]
MEFELSDKTIEMLGKMSAALAGQIKKDLKPDELKDLEMKEAFEDLAKMYKYLYYGLIKQGFDKTESMQVATRMLGISNK